MAKINNLIIKYHIWRVNRIAKKFGATYLQVNEILKYRGVSRAKRRQFWRDTAKSLTNKMPDVE